MPASDPSDAFQYGVERTDADRSVLPFNRAVLSFMIEQPGFLFG